MSFTDALAHPTEVRPYRGSIPLTYRYTAGVAGEKFLRHLMAGKIYGTACPNCDYTYVPPRLYCERCFEALDDANWVEVGPEGELVSFTAVAVDLDGAPLTNPRLVGLVRLDGASGVLLHDLHAEDLAELRVGMRVKAVFKPVAERHGSITDILGFRPL